MHQRKHNYVFGVLDNSMHVEINYPLPAQLDHKLEKLLAFWLLLVLILGPACISFSCITAALSLVRYEDTSQ